MTAQPCLPWTPLETRREAREAIAPGLTDLQNEVLAAIASCGSKGATVFDLVRLTARMKDSVAPRLTELRKLGRIVPCGKRAAPGHRAATAWRVSMKGGGSREDEAEETEEVSLKPADRPRPEGGPAPGVSRLEASCAGSHLQSDPQGQAGTCDRCKAEGTVYEGRAEVERGGVPQGEIVFHVCRSCSMRLLLGEIDE